MKNKLLVIHFSILLFCCSCSSQYYVPALYSNDVLEMSKPHSKDSVKHAIYVQGNYFIAASNGPSIISNYYNNQGGSFNAYRANTFNNFCIAYGILGFIGDYSVSADGGDLNNRAAKVNKSFYGYGINTSASYFTTSGNVDIRLIGLDMVYTHEFGDYADFRKQGANNNGIYIPQTSLFTYSFFTEVSIKKNDITENIKYSLDFTPGNVSSTLNNGEALRSMSLSMTQGYKRVNFIARFSVGVASKPIGNGIHFGFNYRL